MKKIFICSLLAASVMLSTLGCGKASAYSEKDITSAAFNAIQSKIESISLERDKIEGYFGFDKDLLKDFSVLICPAEDEFYEIGAFTPKDQDDLFTIIDGISRRHTDNADSLKLINGSSSSNTGFLLMKIDDTVIYVISKDIESAEKALSDMGATEIN